jgi:hypothetical protein
MSEWSNWFEHDGKSCPVEGQYVQTQRFSGKILENIAGSANRQAGKDPNKIGSAWIWYIGFKFSDHIKSYRIRKPKGGIFHD